MITFWHLLMMLWLGGAIAVTYVLYAFARLKPEEFEEAGLDSAMSLFAVIFWPYSMFRAVQMIQQEVAVREARSQPSASDFIHPQVTAPPQVCSHCALAQQEACEKANKALSDFQFCEDCAVKMKTWRDGYVED